MVKYWFCVINEENWKIMKKRKVWGTTERSRKKLEKIRLGDMMIFYVKPKRIGGIFKAMSDSFENNKSIFSSKGFKKEEIFPYRVKVESVIMPKEWIDFTPLIPRLGFISRKSERWAGTIQGRAIIQISREDYEVIEAEIKRA